MEYLKALSTNTANYWYNSGTQKLVMLGKFFNYAVNNFNKTRLYVHTKQ